MIETFFKCNIYTQFATVAFILAKMISVPAILLTLTQSKFALLSIIIYSLLDLAAIVLSIISIRKYKKN